MEHTKGILLECNLSEEEINTVIEALSRDYVENDPETLEKERIPITRQIKGNYQHFLH